MCTLSWLRQDKDYEIFFNRDELNTRGAEEIPQIRSQGEVRYISPLDSDGGGTWIATNEYGITLCLVNFYTGEIFNPSGCQSRGLILPALISFRNSQDIQNHLRNMPLMSFRPFRLAVFGLGTPVLLAQWDGHDLRVNVQADDQRPVVSSSFNSRDVEQFRREYFQETFQAHELSGEALEAYHHSRHPELSGYSVCMKRPDAQTVSFCRVHVTPAKIVFSYEKDPVKTLPQNHRLILNMDVTSEMKQVA